ncbi:MAG: hypothetical protein KDC12_06935 [Flavobacteriales bacterium]|nr:hypothetical protein [Flavobacteriales bacterium]
MKVLNTNSRFYLLIALLFVILASQLNAAPLTPGNTHDQLIERIAPSFMEADFDMATGAGMGNMEMVFNESSWISTQEYMMHVVILFTIGLAVVLRSGGRDRLIM